MVRQRTKEEIFLNIVQLGDQVQLVHMW